MHNISVTKRNTFLKGAINITIIWALVFLTSVAGLAQDDISISSLFDETWELRDDIPVFLDLEGVGYTAYAYQKEADFRVVFQAEMVGETTLTFDPIWFLIHGLPVLIDPVTGEEQEIDYTFKDGVMFFEVTVADYPKVIKMHATSRKLRNRGELTIEDKLKQARTIRWIRAQTESWSDLKDDQVIAQKTIEPIICHGGYDPDSIKTAIIWANDMTLSGTFELIDCFNNMQHPAPQAVVYIGEIEPAGSHIWGGNNYIADFSDFREEGMYRVRLRLNETAEVTDSNAFEIKEGKYIELAKKAAGWFYYQRCGTEVPGFHKACHMEDAIIKEDGDIVDVSGGWHDAGDYGKWIAGGTVGVWALATFQEYLGMDEDESTTPPFLDEAAWEGRYICKGYWDGIFHPGFTADLEDVCTWLGAPECEPPRVLTEEESLWYKWGPPRTCLTGAVLAKMGRMIAPYDAELSEWSLDIAEEIYETFQPIDWTVDDHGYDASGYLYYVQSGLLLSDLQFYQMTGDEKYMEDARMRVRNLLDQQAENGTFYGDLERSSESTRCGYHHIALYEFYRQNPESPLNDEIRDAFDRWANYHLPFSKLSAFGQIGGELDDRVVNLCHNSTSTITALAWGMATAALVTGNSEYLDVAEHELQWITGFNPTNISFMAGVGFGPGCYHHRYCFMEGHADGAVPGGIITGIQPGTGGIIELGDMDTKNWVAAELPLDYPIMDSDVCGWTYSYKTNEYSTWKNSFYTIAAIQIEEALKALR